MRALALRLISRGKSLAASVPATRPSYGSFRLFSSTHISPDQVQERVFSVLRAFDKVAADKLQPSSQFTADLGLDSLDVVEVVMAVEEEFGMEIPDAAADEFKTPQDVIVHLQKRLAEPGVAEH